MTLTQLQKWIIRQKGKRTWRKFAEDIDTHYQDLHAAANGREPKSGVLKALNVRRTTVARYKKETA